MMERRQDIDLLKGFGILLMVFNHIGWGRMVHIYIQSFHMPLFFIVSGYLWKQRAATDLSRKRQKSLLLPYGVFAFLYFVIAAVFNIAKNGDFQAAEAAKAVLLFPTDNAHMPISPALWFLPCMFLTSLIYAVLGKLSLGKKSVVILAAAVAGAVYSGLSDYMLPFCIEPTAAALLFMLVGEWIHRRCVDEKLLSKWYYIVGLLCIHALLAFINGSVDMRTARFHFVPLYYLNGVLGTLAFWGIAKTILRIFNLGRVRGFLLNELQIIGHYSIVCLCSHQLFILILKDQFDNLLRSGTLYRAVFQLLIYIVVLVLCRVLVALCKRNRLVQFAFGL